MWNTGKMICGWIQAVRNLPGTAALLKWKKNSRAPFIPFWKTVCRATVVSSGCPAAFILEQGRFLQTKDGISSITSGNAPTFPFPLSVCLYRIYIHLCKLVISEFITFPFKLNVKSGRSCQALSLSTNFQILFTLLHNHSKKGSDIARPSKIQFFLI